MTRRVFLPMVGGTAMAMALSGYRSRKGDGPNIFLVITDDQSWCHTSSTGSPWIRTPNYDRLVGEGVHFTRAFASAPICTPTRAALLTGGQPWSLGEGMQLCGTLPAEHVTYPELLAKRGWHCGATGKGWGPGDHAAAGRAENPAGRFYREHRFELTEPSSKLSRFDYVENFRAFMKARPKGAPFCFWLGIHEPHVPLESGSGLRAGKKLEDVVVPPFLPDTPEVRSDLLDYALEIEWADIQLGRVLDELKKSGEMENTLIVMTSDNGMPFPGGKGTCYEYGIRVPLALSWQGRFRAARHDCLASTVDVAATIFEATGLELPERGAGVSLLGLCESGRERHERTAVFAGRERQNDSRAGDLGYPVRAIRTAEWLYIENAAPERWPGGDPEEFRDLDPTPTKALLLERRDDGEIGRFFRKAAAPRPARELYRPEEDPGCWKNLAEEPEHAEVVAELSRRLQAQLLKDGDLRALGRGDEYEAMPFRLPRRGTG